MTSEFKKQNSISCLTTEKIITRHSFFPALWHMRENVECQWFSSMSGVLETKERWQNLEGFFGLLLPPKVLKPRKILSEGILIFWFYCYCWHLMENASLSLTGDLCKLSLLQLSEFSAFSGEEWHLTAAVAFIYGHSNIAERG